MGVIDREQLLGCPKCGSEELSCTTLIFESISFDVNGNFECEETLDYGDLIEIQCIHCDWSMGEQPTALRRIGESFIEEHTAKVKQEFLKELKANA